ncbi:MAG: HigA family addiction module antidote protein [Rhodospirillales bacterium]|nr:HigA family addiction module antidote protein [Rhodospirillales bacterium]
MRKVIKKKALDRGLVDFSDIASGRRLPPIHPGETLRDEFLHPLGINVYELANALKMPRSRANDIARGRRAISADSALRLARYFGTTPDFWLNLQTRYDLECAKRSLGRTIQRAIVPRAA